MLRRLNRKAQSTGEYAVMFALLLGAVVAMQSYIRRGLQQGIKLGTQTLVKHEHAELDADLDKLGLDLPALPVDDTGFAVRAADQTSDAYSKVQRRYKEDITKDYEKLVDEEAGTRADSITVQAYDGTQDAQLP